MDWDRRVHSARCGTGGCMAHGMRDDKLYSGLRVGCIAQDAGVEEVQDSGMEATYYIV
jgi:hypothetical protein